MFGKRLKELRENKKITRDEFAKELKITYQAITNYENGQREPNFEKLKDIATYFGVTTDYLVGKSNFANIEEEYKIKKLIKNNDYLDSLEPSVNDKIVTMLRSLYLIIDQSLEHNNYEVLEDINKLFQEIESYRLKVEKLGDELENITKIEFHEKMDEYFATRKEKEIVQEALWQLLLTYSKNTKIGKLREQMQNLLLEWVNKKEGVHSAEER